jgi:hypothetical protein
VNAVRCWTQGKAEWREEAKSGAGDEWIYQREYVFMFWIDKREKFSGVETLGSRESRGRMSGLSARVWEKIKKTGD